MTSVDKDYDDFKSIVEKSSELFSSVFIDPAEILLNDLYCNITVSLHND